MLKWVSWNARCRGITGTCDFLDRILEEMWRHESMKYAQGPSINKPIGMKDILHGMKSPTRDKSLKKNHPIQFPWGAQALKMQINP